jgi:regulator of nucleoside diphosphate kinase
VSSLSFCRTAAERQVSISSHPIAGLSQTIRAPEATMKKRKLFVTAFDKERLDDMLAEAREFGDHDRKDLDELAAELARAKVVKTEKIPANVVTLNSKVLLRDLNKDEEKEYRLVFPQEANIATGAISVLAPVGTAILGYSEGDEVEWQVPAGTRRFRIEKVLYQPEAAGHLNL